MALKTVILAHPEGLHARPAAKFVERAQSYQAEIRLVYNSEEANAKSILSVLTLGADQGANVEIHAQGEDAEQAVAELAAFLEGSISLSTPE